MNAELLEKHKGCSKKEAKKLKNTWWPARLDSRSGGTVNFTLTSIETEEGSGVWVQEKKVPSEFVVADTAPLRDINARSFTTDDQALVSADGGDVFYPATVTSASTRGVIFVRAAAAPARAQAHLACSASTPRTARSPSQSLPPSWTPASTDSTLTDSLCASRPRAPRARKRAQARAQPRRALPHLLLRLKRL